MNTKSIKEFFRPTKVKMLLFVILTSVLYIETINLLQSLNPGSKISYLVLASILPTIILIPLIILLNNTSLFTIVMIASAISGYLFSCLIVSLYKYFRRFKHNKFIRVFFVIVVLILFIPLPIQESPSLVVSDTTIREFQKRCNNLCEGKALIDYCTYYFGKNEVGLIDLDKNKVENLLGVSKRNWPACEDRVYCFLYVPCKKLGNTSTEIIQNCAKLLCQNYLEKYNGNVEYANEAVLRHIRISTNLTECNFSEIPEENNWHKKFFPENVCEKYINKTAD